MPRRGRPSNYKADYAHQAYKLCLLGATDSQLADFFDVPVSTISNWKHQQPDFMESLKQGKDEADANVANSLYRRACGYEHEDVHIAIYRGKTIKTKFTKHYPPDPTSCIFWLKNRQKDKWRDRMEHAGAEGKDLFPNLTVVIDGASSSSTPR